MVTGRREDQDGGKKLVLRSPRLSQHADLVNPFPLIDLLSAVGTRRDFDVMLECKAKDLALLRLRVHLRAHLIIR
jgi:UV DNA damage endonuclease